MNRKVTVMGNDIVQVSLKDKIVPTFYKSWKAYSNPKYIHIYEKGGRGSSKSTSICMKLVLNRIQTKTHAICVRKFAKTLRHSVRNQILWCIHHIGVEGAFEWSSAPFGDMTITYKPTGAKIFFEGADGDKLKGWKTFDMPTVDIFFEEITDFLNDEELTSIKLSIMREQLVLQGFKYTFFHSYNPPKRKGHWVNKLCESAFIPSNMYVHHSDYRGNPYLPDEFMIEADHIKATNPRRYEWEYLGFPIGSGIVPFDNLQFRAITDDEIKGFDNLRAGHDWGYSIDPDVFVVWHYDKKRNIIYAVDEIHGIKMSFDILAQKIHEKGYCKQRTIADSAEPRSINEMTMRNCRFVGAKKGAGSVEHGEKWLDDLEAIIIDPKRTPNVAKDFEDADYVTDKDGNVITRLEHNDSVDATRYAMEDDMRKSKKTKTMSKEVFKI